MNELSSRAVHLPALVMLVLVAYGIYASSPRLVSQRPDATPTHVADHRGHEDVAARLWQDPFEAIHRLDAAQHTAAPSLLQLSQEIASRRATQSLQILVGCTSGQPYAEAREDRLRRRQAVVSALNVSGYIAEDSSHIGYATFVLSDRDERRRPKKPARIPYEWFMVEDSKRTVEHKQVLVLWLNDVDFGGLEDLLEVVHCLVSPNAANAAQCAQRVAHTALPGVEIGGNPIDVAVLGPLNSNQLVDFVRTAYRNHSAIESQVKAIREKASSDKVEGEFEVVTFAATISDKGIRNALSGDFERHKIESTQCPETGCLHDVFVEKEKGGGKKSPTELPGFNIRRGIDSDWALAQSLVYELEFRGLAPHQNPGNHVALVAEWDTYYARAWTRTFKDCAGSLASTDLSEEEYNNMLRQIHRFSYLRGLDGVLPGQGMAKPKRDPTASRDGEGEILPVGTSQLDGVLRLTESMEGRLEGLNEGAPTPWHRKNYVAIGILGSDVYDKLLLLRALREQHPQAVFFTVDLDARLFDESERLWTRNLLIASHFGLTLDRQLQRDILPFRDSYATSAYWTTLKILGGARPNRPELQSEVANPELAVAPHAPVRLFEIGRSDLVELAQFQREGKKIVPISAGISRSGFWPSVWLLALLGLVYLLSRWYASRLNANVEKKS